LALWLVLLLTGCSQDQASAPADPVPVNTYAAEDFVQAGGFLTYAGDGPSYIGVDVSSYQGQIDWEAVRAAGVEFAIIRVGYRGYTEGELYEDTCFRQNMEDALAAGLEVGAYFFSQAVTEDEAREEAAFVLELLEGYDLAYPVVFDWERQGADASRTSQTDGTSRPPAPRRFAGP
jgi:GH25 family lysozyme M1 (1,4-beta-N-acetylmuramidase)